MTSGRLKDLLSHVRQTGETRDETRDNPLSQRVSPPVKNDVRETGSETSFSAEYLKDINGLAGRDTNLSHVSPPGGCDMRQPPPLAPLSPEAEARRQKVLALLARDGGHYAVYVGDPNSDPVIAALATPAGTCELLIPRDRYDPFEVLAVVKEWEREDPDPLWWRVAITEPGARTIEVDSPSGWTLADAQAYADRYHGPGCAVAPLVPLPKPRAPVNLDEALAAACGGVAITPEVFRSLLSREDVEDIEAGGIHRKTLGAYARVFADGMRSGRIAALPERKGAKPGPSGGSVAITDAEIEAAFTRSATATTPKGSYLLEQFADSTKAPQVRHGAGCGVSENATAGGCGVSENAPEPSGGRDGL